LLSLLDALPILRRSFLRRACLPRWSNTTTKNTVFARSIPIVVDLFMVSSCLFSFLNRCLASISSGASRRRRGRGRRPSHRAPARPVISPQAQVLGSTTVRVPEAISAQVRDCLSHSAHQIPSPPHSQLTSETLTRLIA